MRNTAPDAVNKIQLTNEIESLTAIHPLVAYEYTGKSYGVGGKYGLLLANIEFGLENKDTADKMRPYLKELAKELKNKA